MQEPAKKMRLSTGRLHGLDACRAAAMTLGLFFHGAFSFTITGAIPWAVQDRDKSFGADVFIWVCHTFRLPVFFLLAGFFARLLYVKLGPIGFLRHRVKRILLPFLAALVPLMPLLFWLWRWAASKSVGSVRPWLGMDDPGTFSPSLGHLWFLYYLMFLLAGLVLGAIVLGPFERLRKGADTVVRAAIRYRVVMLVMAIPTAITLFPMADLTADTPASMVPQLRILIYYFVFTAFGWVLHRNADLVEEFGKRLWIPLIFVLVTFGPSAMLVEQTARTGQLEPTWLRMVALYINSVFGWSLVVLFVGAFVKWGSQQRAWVSYLSDASYWSYLIHFPVVVAMQILVADFFWPGPIKYVLIMAVTVAVCLITYQAFVRYSFIGATLNGPRERPVAALTGSSEVDGVR